MDLIDRLKAAVKASGKLQKQIAHDAGLDATKLSRLLRGQIKANIEDVEAVLAALGRTMQSLYAGEAEVDVRLALKTLTDYVDKHEVATRVIPKKRAPSRLARTFPVAATPNVTLFDERKRRRVEIPPSLWKAGARYAASVVGDSMIDAGINDGDIVYFRQPAAKRPPRGELVIIRVNDGVYLKRYDESRGEKRLLSDNEAYRAIVLQPEDDVELYGIVVRDSRVHEK